MPKPLKSSSLLFSIYYRFFARRLIGFIALAALCAALGAQILFLSYRAFGLERLGVNVVFTLALAVAVFALGRYLWSWASDGIFPKRFFHRWEAYHPDLAHRASLVIYSDRKKAEIDRLGYSHELIEAEDQLLIDKLREFAERKDASPLWLPVTVAAAALALTAVLWAAQREQVENDWVEISQALHVYQEPYEELRIRVPAQTAQTRGEPMTLVAEIEGDTKGEEAVLHREFRSGWERVSARPGNGRVEFALPGLTRELVYYVSVGDAMSNRGVAVPLDPPTIAQGTIKIEPPEYTRLPEETLSRWRNLSAPVGSWLQFDATASAELTGATAYWRGQAHSLSFEGREFVVRLHADGSDEFYVEMSDINGLSGESPRLRVSMIEDATPTVDIVQPGEISQAPSEMRIPVAVHLKDDYGVRNVILHSVLNDDETSAIQELAWTWEPEAQDDIGQATDFYINFEWNIAPRQMYPGDELAFWLEAYDEDPFHGPKAGRSKTHTIRYPSLMDMVDDLTAAEEEQVDDLNEVVGEQKQIREELGDTIERISEKLENPGADSEGEESFWMEKQELEALKGRQEELVEQARRIEEELEAYQDSANQEMSPQQQQEQGFTPDTLEKISRVQDLMSELLDQDSQRMMQQMEEAIEQLSDEISPEQLQELEFNVEDFEQQLDRTLSMLESTYDFRQMEGLRQTATELAQRQDHLMRETEQLEDELAQMSSELSSMEEQAEQLTQAQQQAAEQNQASQSGEQASEENQGQENQQSGENAESESAQGEQSESGESPDGEQGEESKPSEEEQRLAEEMKQLQEQIDAKKAEMEAKKNILAKRQERLQNDTDSMMQQMKQMQEQMSESNPELAQQLQQMSEQLQQQGALQQMSQAVERIQSQRPQDALPNQQKAMDALQQMSQQMQNQMANMGLQNMQEDSNAIKRLVDRGLFLSDELEGLTESTLGQSEALQALRTANVFMRELKRVHGEWDEIAQTNPFMNRAVERLLQESEERLLEAVEAGQGVRWLGLHESRQSLIALNRALNQMLKDNQQMQQQMQQQQMGSQQMQQQMQQMMQQQQNLNQMMQQLRQQGEEGERMAEQLQRMAERQAQIRKQIERMMQQYRHARQMKNQLQGIYDEMEEVEKMMKAGETGEELEERQERIMSRLLEAGTFQEEDEYGRERREERPDDVTEAESPEGGRPQDAEDKIRRSIQQPPLDQIPPAFREAIKNHYIRLSNEPFPG